MFCLLLVTEWLQLLQALSLHNTTSKARRENWLLRHVSMCLLWHCIFPRCIQPTSPKPITSKWKYPDKLSSILDHPLGLGEDALATGDRASFDLWFKAYAIFWSTGPHPKRASSTSWLLSWETLKEETFKSSIRRHVYCNTHGSYSHMPIAATLQENEFLGCRSVLRKIPWRQSRYSVGPQVVVLARLSRQDWQNCAWVMYQPQ